MNDVQARMSALQAIEMERDQQDQQWGGPDHDDKHTGSSWTLLLTKHVGRLAGDMVEDGEGDDHYDRDDLYRRTIVLAALALAFAEWQNRRHGWGSPL